MLTNTSEDLVCDHDRSVFTDSSGFGFVEDKGCLDTICMDCELYSCFHTGKVNNPCKKCRCQATKAEIFQQHNLSADTASGYGLKCVCGHSISYHIIPSEPEQPVTPKSVSKKPNMMSTPTLTSSLNSFPMQPHFSDSHYEQDEIICIDEDTSESRSLLDESSSTSCSIISMGSILVDFKKQSFYPYRGFDNVKDHIFCNPLFADNLVASLADENLQTAFNKLRSILQNYADTAKSSLVSRDLSIIRHCWSSKNDGGCLQYLGFVVNSAKSKEFKCERKNQSIQVGYQLYVLRKAYIEGVEVRKKDGTTDLTMDMHNFLRKKLSDIPATLDDVMFEILPLLHLQIQNNKKDSKPPQMRTGTVLLQANTSSNDSYNAEFLSDTFGIPTVNKGNL